MNVLFLTMSKMRSIEERFLYTDLMRLFCNRGHQVYTICPIERREGAPTSEIVEGNSHIIAVRTLNVKKTNVVEKGLGQLSIEFLYKRALNKYCNNVYFDLILYSTPPITFSSVIEYVKSKNPDVVSYLLLKDIFPQNAVDMGILTKTGVKGLLYKFFRNKEKKLYELSDYIGCMSPANVKFVLNHNPEVALRNSKNQIVEVAPNSIELNYESSACDRNVVLGKYNLPSDKPIFIYGGNLGVPQGIPFLIECLEANKNRKDCHFVVVGNGTYYQKLADWYKNNLDTSVTVLRGLPKVDYDQLVQACNVGLIFLDYRFTIPNFPSRLLSYLENKMPVICATDPNCDMGQIANENGFGVWCPSNDVEAFTASVDKILSSDICTMGTKGFEFLVNNYLVEHTYNQIVKHII